MELPSEKRDPRGSKSQSPMSLHIAKSGKKSNCCIAIIADNAVILSEKQLRLTQLRPNLQILHGSNKHQMNTQFRMGILGFGKGF